jgi:hypothetical protein
VSCISHPLEIQGHRTITREHEIWNIQDNAAKSKAPATDCTKKLLLGLIRVSECIRYRGKLGDAHHKFAAEHPIDWQSFGQ